MRQLAERPVTLLSLVSLLIIMASAPTRVAAQQGEPDEVIRVSTDLVVLDAQVTDRRTGRVVGDLRREDFEIYEDGTRQEITYFAQDALPLSILLLLDMSGSVRPLIHQIRDGALEALRRLKPEDEVAVMAFADRPELVQGFTRDRQLVSDRIHEASRSDHLGNATFLRQALFEAATQMQRASSPASRRVIIVLTDNIAIEPGAIDAEQIKAELGEAGAVVYGLIVRGAVGSVFRILSLGTLRAVNTYADDTGGEVLDAGRSEVAARLGEILARLRTRYALGYRPTNTTEDGRLRQLRVRVTAAAERQRGRLAVRTKRGYYFRRRPTAPNS